MMIRNVDCEDLLNRFTGELSFGGGAVNQVNVHLFVLTMPFGGVGADGMGHYYAKYGFDALTPAKPVLIAPPDGRGDRASVPALAAGTAITHD